MAVSPPVMPPPLPMQAGTHGLLDGESSCVCWNLWVLPHAPSHSGVCVLMYAINNVMQSVIITFAT